MSTILTELIFPPYLISTLAGERNSHWKELIGTSADWEDASCEQIALTLMLARLNNCATCTTNSYRSTQGCESCAKQMLKRYRGSDKELIEQYNDTLSEVTEYLTK